MSVSESVDRSPVEYLPTGDHALLVAWTDGPSGLHVVLCLEDGRVVAAPLDQIKFDYRFVGDKWFDVSRTSTGENQDANSDPKDEDHGGPGVSGLLPPPD